VLYPERQKKGATIFPSFERMAGEVLRPVRLKDHKMHPQVEEGFHAAGDHCFSPAELIDHAR
jgi:hypothetical protein